MTGTFSTARAKKTTWNIKIRPKREKLYTRPGLKSNYVENCKQKVDNPAQFVGYCREIYVVDFTPWNPI